MSAIRKEVMTAKFDARCVDIPFAGCRVWTGALNRDGYGTLVTEGTRWKAHRLAWTIECGEIPAGVNVLHRCDVRCCVRIDHLFLGSQADNMRDMAKKGRARGPRGRFRGAAHINAKLTEADVIAIRGMARRDLSYPEIGRIFGIHPTNVGIIVRREGWAHVD